MTPFNTPANPVAIQDQYDNGFQVCYGCGSRNEGGLHIKSFVSGDEVVAEFQPKPEHQAVPGVVYGGLIASLIDCHGIAAGAAYFQAQGEADAPPPRCVTASLQVEYRAPTPLDGKPLRLVARVEEASTRKAIVQVDLIANDKITAQGRVIGVRIS